MEEVLIPLGLFAMVVFIVALNVFAGNSRRKAMLETVREAMRSGQEMTPETIAALGVEPKKKSNNDLKAGAILMAVAAALLTVGWAIASTEGDTEIMVIMTAIAAFPGFIGLVLVIFGLFNGDKSKDEG